MSVVAELLPDGRLRTAERWPWTNGDEGRGVLIEAGAERPEFAPLRSGGCEDVMQLVARDGIEPPTRGFSVRCSTS